MSVRQRLLAFQNNTVHIARHAVRDEVKHLPEKVTLAYGNNAIPQLVR
jgi:hypothetical protein